MGKRIASGNGVSSSIAVIKEGAVKRVSGGNIDSLNAKSGNAAALAVYAGRRHGFLKGN